MTGDAMNVSGSQQYNIIKLKYFGSLIHHHHILEALQDHNNNGFPTLPNKTIQKCCQFSSINNLLVLILGETTFGSGQNRTIIVYGNGRATNNEAIIRERYRCGY